MLCMIETGKRISIHAPPRGATRLNAPRIIRELISIHAPPRGATAFLVGSHELDNFNSRPSARGDQEERAGFVIDNISIHAPPRGATLL